jgi:hypothetical protein
MYAGNGAGEPCDGCTETIERTQLEWEAVYEDGREYHLHLGCAGLWDVERQRRARYIADGPAKKAVHEQHE